MRGRHIRRDLGKEHSARALEWLPEADIASWPAPTTSATLSFSLSVMRPILIKPGNEPRRPRAISIILIAELRAQQRFLRVDAHDDRQNHGHDKQQTDSGTKRQRPSQRIDQQSKIT